MESDRLVLRAVTDEIMYAIHALSDQEYVDIYASTQKSRLAKQGREEAAAAGEAPATGARSDTAADSASDDD
jgi:1-acyl-sn-glycerol-3-phosphate acyltransferase